MTHPFTKIPHQRSTKRQGTLGGLLALTGLASILLLLAALGIGLRSARVARDVNRSGSLRYRSLWLYGATHGGGADWHPQVAAMATIRARLRTRYPHDVADTDPTWDALIQSLQRTGRVDWPTANAQRVADDTLTGHIAARATAQNAATARWLWLDLLFVVLSLVAAARLLGGLREAEDALLAQHEFQHALLESLQEGIVACDAAGTLTLFNRATREFHGLPEQPLPAGQWAEHFDLYAADGLTPLRTEDIPLFRALQGEVVCGAEMVIAPRDGARRTILAGGQAIYGPDGRKLGAVVAMHDVTERRQMEREMTRLAAIVESSEEAILAGTLDGTLVSWNAGAERLYGYAASEVIGRHASVLAQPHEKRLITSIIARLLRGEVIEPMEVVRDRKDGSVVDVSLSFSPVRDAEGQVVGMSCISRDITARKRIEKDLREREADLHRSNSVLRAQQEAAPDGILVVDENRRIVGYNRRLCELWDTPQEIIEAGDDARHLDYVLSLMRHPEEFLARVMHLYEHPQESSHEEIELRDGRILDRYSGPVRSETGQDFGRVWYFRDVTERKRAAAARQESEARLAEAQRVAKVGSWDFDVATGKITWSDQLFRLFGLDPADGEPDIAGAVSLYHFEDAPKLEAVVARAVQTGEGYELDLRRAPDGGPIQWYHTVGTAVTDGTGRAVRLTGTLTDITERKALEADLRERAERLRRSEAALRTVLESAPVILYAADADGTITLSEGTGLAALGLKPGEAVGRSVFEFSRDDPETSAKTRRALAGEALSYDARYSSLSLHVELRPVRDAGGGPGGLIGVCFDVTERVALEERFRVLFDHSAHPHFLVDGDGIVDCNAAAVAMLRCVDKAQLLASHPAVFSPGHQPDGRSSHEKALEMDRKAREQGSHRFEWIHRRLDGEEFPVEVTLTPVTLNERPVLLSALYDLTERKRAEQQAKDYRIVLEFQKAELERANADLAALATTDGLTGLLNHRAFQERLAEEVSRATRYDEPLSLLMLDVDHFKQYNDAFGHPAGDDVLRRVARTLETSTRTTDTASRYGGEEFVVILPQTDSSGAQVIAERVRAAVAAGPWPRRPITASIGVCTLSLDTPTSAALVACADAALYRSKLGGRDRVTYAASPDEAPGDTAHLHELTAAA